MGGEGIAVDAAECLGAVETGAILKALGGGDGQREVGEDNLELVETGLERALQ